MSWTSTSRKRGTGAGSQCVKADKVSIVQLFCKWKSQTWSCEGTKRGS